MHGKIDDGTVLYASDANAQVGYLRLLKDHGMEAVLADTMVDQHFLPYVEMQTGRKWTFKRVDSDLAKHLVDDAKPEIVIDPASKQTAAETLEKLFKDHLAQPTKIRIEALKSDKVPAMLIVDEQARRMKDMARTNKMMAQVMGQMGMQKDEGPTLVVNQNSPAVKNLIRLAQTFNRDEEVKLVVNQIYDLAWLQQGEITADMMQGFIDRSAAILGRLGRVEA
jgi:molecular chaperone HtpG